VPLTRTRLAAVPLVLAMLATVGAGCEGAPTTTPADGSAPSANPTVAAKKVPTDHPVNQVLAISIDGLNPRAIGTLGGSGAPAFHRLMREGAWTFNARTERESTQTLPNHTGMLTGRRVDEKRGGHGVDFNTDNGKTVHQAAGHYVASVFDVVHDRGGRTAMFTAKKKFRFYSRTWNTHGAADRVGKDDGRKKIDRVTIDANNTRLVGELNAELRTKPRQFTFLHISLPDVVGHRDGFMGEEYLAAVRETDQLLGSVLSTIAARPALKRHLLVILTADHGGDGNSHSDPSQLQNMRVPFMVWGPGVAAGRNLHSLNADFRSPAGTRPTYAGKQPIRNGDVANLATDVLDLPRVPGSEHDTLDVFG
jgi:hypothetical protein